MVLGDLDVGVCMCRCVLDFATLPGVEVLLILYRGRSESRRNKDRSSRRAEPRICAYSANKRRSCPTAVISALLRLSRQPDPYINVDETRLERFPVLTRAL